MSYAVDPPKKRQAQGMGAYSKINMSSSEIDAIDPLALVNLKKQITQELVQLKTRQRQLEDFHRQIGSDKDSRQFRRDGAKLLGEQNQAMKNAANDIKQFTDAPGDNKRQQIEQARAFKENQQLQMRKLVEIGNRIKTKQMEFAEIAQQSMNSMMESRMSQASSL